MKITRDDYGRRGAFKAIEDERQIGEMSYFWDCDTVFAIDHTNVAPEFEGQGVGRSMVMEAVKYARENNLKIIPICPFVVAIFKRNPSFGDVKEDKN